ncbi:MAG: VWA domain-containing protein [Candidatus Aminicenantales bacterium]|jgi:VWFA-related protein
MNRNKGISVPAAVLAVLAFVLSPALSQEKGPVPVTVAVRVFDGGQFVEGLALRDFELLENGVPQRIDALFKVDRNAVTRQEGEGPALPVTARRFFLLFQMYEYNPKVSEALRYFFNNALLPGDTMEIQTSMRNYMLTPAAFAKKPKDVLAKEMDDIVRKDINQGNFVYKGLMRDLRRMVQGIEGLNPVAGGDEESDASVSTFGLEYLLNQYKDSLHKLEGLRTLDQDKIVGFAQALRKLDGRKFVFFFYQQEFRPEISPSMFNTLIDNNQESQNILADLHDLFQTHHQNISLDQQKIVQAYCDSSADLNFLFMNRTPERLGGITMRDQSQDVFKIFAQAATATGGIAESTQNPTAEIRDALKASETYYLLSYTPASAAKDGEFRTITVKVKDKDYKVLCRRGYIKS